MQALRDLVHKPLAEPSASSAQGMKLTFFNQQAQSKESIAIQCECIGHHEREATDGPGILTSKKGIGIDQ